MIRLPTFEESLPELTAEESAALSEFDINDLIEKVTLQLPPEERKQWTVTDRWGNVIMRYKTEGEARASAVDRNRRAKQMGLWMSYRVAKDQGFNE